MEKQIYDACFHTWNPDWCSCDSLCTITPESSLTECHHVKYLAKIKQSDQVAHIFLCFFPSFSLYTVQASSSLSIHERRSGSKHINIEHGHLNVNKDVAKSKWSYNQMKLPLADRSSKRSHSIRRTVDANKDLWVGEDGIQWQAVEAKSDRTGGLISSARLWSHHQQKWHQRQLV